MAFYLHLSGLFPGFTILLWLWQTKKSCRAQYFIPSSYSYALFNSPPVFSLTVWCLCSLTIKCSTQHFCHCFVHCLNHLSETWAVDVLLSAVPVLYAESTSSGYYPFHGAWKSFLGWGLCTAAFKGWLIFSPSPGQQSRWERLFCTMHYTGFSAWDFPVSSPVLRVGVQCISQCFSMCLNSDSMVVAAALRQHSPHGSNIWKCSCLIPAYTGVSQSCPYNSTSSSQPGHLHLGRSSLGKAEA